MTQQELDILRLIQEEQRAEEERFKHAVDLHKERAGALNRQHYEICRDCDHKYPDGKSAWKGGFMFSSCEICGLTDL